MPFGQGLRFRPAPSHLITRRRTFPNRVTIVRNRAPQTRSVNRVMTNRAEKKHCHVSIDENAGIDQNGTIVKLSAMGQSSDNHDRVGSYARPISLVMRYAMNPGSPNFTLVRMIIFQWHCDDTDGPPTNDDVLENTLADTNNMLFSSYKQDNNNTTVLWDKMSWVAGETGSSQRVLTGKVMIPKSKIKQLRYGRGGLTTGSEMIFLLLVSSRLDSDLAALKPNFIGIPNIRFTDL